MPPSVVWTDRGLFRNLETLGPKVSQVVGAVMQRNAIKVQDYARRNAPWTDRTGNARQGLFARYSGDRNSMVAAQFGGTGNAGRHVITLSHSVNYGIWLEVRWAGKYAIIAPTIQIEGERIMKQMKGLMGKLNSLSMGGL